MRRVNLGGLRERRTRAGWIQDLQGDAAIRASWAPGGIRIETTAHTMTITHEQAQTLCSQIRTESRKR